MNTLPQLPFDEWSKLTDVPIWSRRPPEEYKGRIMEWYETLYKVIDDYSDGGNIITSPEVACILESTLMFKANIRESPVTLPKIGSFESRINGKLKQWDIYVDPYFPRNKITIVDSKGSKQDVVVAHLIG